MDYRGAQRSIPREHSDLVDNARWYGPSISRFVSADTIVPGAGNPQAMNRFEYVFSNPLRFTDPSGFYVCDDVDAFGNCITWTADQILTDFGITTINVDEASKWETASGAISTGIAIGSLTNQDPSSAFISAHGRITLTINSDADIKDSANCIADLGTITCKWAFTFTTIVHEFGHVFDKKYQQMSTIDDVPEDNIDRLASDYLPWEWINDDRGYVCNKIPCIGHVISDQTEYPRGEEWGNMYMNWIFEKLNISPATSGFLGYGLGTDRYLKMNNLMPNLLENMGLR